MKDLSEDTLVTVIGEIDDAFADSLNFEEIVNPSNWQAPGEYYQTMPAAARATINKVVEDDERIRQELRGTYFPEMLRAGTLQTWEKANQAYIDLLKRKKLYAGKVAAADATLSKYETLSLVGAQIAVSKVSYRKTTGQIVSNIMCWGKELPRRTSAKDIAEAIRTRGKELREKLSNVFLYALTLYKERQFLLDSAPDAFKIIQGPVFPYEMLSGSGRQFTMLACLDLIGKMIDDANYATIVSSDTHRELLFLGSALDPGEFIIVNSGTDVLQGFLASANYTNTIIPQYGNRSQLQLFGSFMETYGPKVVQGVLRAHRMSAPYVFYCNLDKVYEAVHILLADAANTGPRGFPLLVDLADQYCSGSFKASEYANHLNAEFARASGGSGKYQSERSTRD